MKAIKEKAISTNSELRILLFAFAVLMAFNGFSQTDTLQTKQRLLPLAKKWFDKKNIDLPLPFGVSAFFTYMSRDVNITNVDVAFKDQPKQSINDFASFELNNKSSVSAIKLDAWLLPFLNVYGLLGSVSTNASMDLTLTIERPVLPGPPVSVPIKTQSTINGLYYGLGSTMVAGHGNWFILGDANYGYSNLNEFDGKIDFWMFSARTGVQSKINKNNLRTWVGAMYLLSKRTLYLNVENEFLGMIQVDVHQKTKNPVSLQLGSSLGIGKHFEVLTELGSNFEDAGLGVMSVTYRF